MSLDLVTVLDGIVARHGAGILDDRPRLFALLRDHAPTETRAVRVLMTAYDAGALGRIRTRESGNMAAAIDDETAGLVDQFGLSQDLARSAVETWCAFVTRSPAPRPLPAAGLLSPARVSGTVDSLGRTAPGRWIMITTGLVGLVAGSLRRLGAFLGGARSP